MTRPQARPGAPAPFGEAQPFVRDNHPRTATDSRLSRPGSAITVYSAILPSSTAKTEGEPQPPARRDDRSRRAVDQRQFGEPRPGGEEHRAFRHGARATEDGGRARRQGGWAGAAHHVGGSELTLAGFAPGMASLRPQAERSPAEAR